ncbi:MAG: sugar ABC transporter permease [Alicyclobacillus sp.]|nr:sugar ABC transporter permease [Alicyclobacillus sp.]
MVPQLPLLTSVVVNMATSRDRRKIHRSPLLFLLPTIAFNLIVVTGPALGTLVMSFTDWDGYSQPNFIGIRNYINLFTDNVFLTALRNNVQWMMIFCTIPIILALLVAIMVTNIPKGATFFRVVLFLPYTLSTVLVAEIWNWIYDPMQGINTILQALGVKNTPFWLGDPHMAIYCIAAAAMWQGWGFLLVIFIAALSQLDKSLEEASLIEGASSIQRFWYVTLPQLRPTIILVLMLSIIGSFTVFDYIYLMTGGGPANASQVISSYMYQEALYNQQPGYASSIAAVLGLFAVAVIGLFAVLRKRGWDI